ncbi:MAG: bifunctional phosphopantothenoylcysteine decarboxylase/phosphopantothenate--cysteine ligase CoaBC [Bacteroidia bacterium]
MAKIILGVTGGIAAYKSVILLRLLKKAGHKVKVITTPSVPHFVGELTFSTLSGEPVFSGLWNENWSAHVEMGLWGDLMVVAPATANTLAKFAHGLCDNALTATYLAAKCPVMIAPAMDRDMITHQATQRNLQTLKDDGCIVLDTGEGFLASGLEGQGRMLEPEEIFQHITQFLFEKEHGQPLKGKKLLLTAGPTQEALDPVRYISNHSTGKMGIALATEASKLGAEVTLILGTSPLPVPSDIQLIKVTSAQDMLEAVQKKVATQDIIIMAAAVADYTPITVADKKIKKKTDDFLLELKKTTDILKTVGVSKLPHQILVGFALETDNELENAMGKLRSKNADFIVLNSMQDAGAGFGHDTNKITLLDKTGKTTHFPLKSKTEVARDILREIAF